jgi:hypothetical protein
MYVHNNNYDKNAGTPRSVPTEKFSSFPKSVFGQKYSGKIYFRCFVPLAEFLADFFSFNK